MTLTHSDVEPALRPRRQWLAWLLSWKVGLPAAALLLAASGVLVCREAYVWDVPDIGEPFDLKLLEGELVPPEQNAWKDYEAAAALLVPKPDGLWEEINPAVRGTWADASPAVRDWLDDNRAALERWRVGTERVNCMRFPPRTASKSMFDNNAWDNLQDITDLARLQIRKFGSTGAKNSAWEWYRALLRYSRHLGMHEDSAGRWRGSLKFEIVSHDISRWAGHDDVTKEQLAVALQDVRAAYALTPPPSRAVRIDYLWFTDELRDIDGLLASAEEYYSHTSSLGPDRTVPSKQLLFWQNEPLLTQRLLKHQTANLLLHIDKPLSHRPPLISGEIRYFDAAPPAQSDLLAPHHFVAATNRTWLSGDLLRINGMGTTYPVAERANQAALEIVLAAEYFRRDHGVYPEHLDRLVTDGLTPEVPVDPWSATGEPMHYARDPDDASRARVWSVGPNQVDDGGDVSGREPSDSGFQLGSELNSD